MRMRSLVVALGLGFAIASGADAQTSWQTYVHPSLGTQIIYPANIFTDVTETATGVALAGSGAMLELSVLVVPEIQTVADLRKFLRGGLGYDDVTYTASGNTWLVVSGFRSDRIFYEKFFIVGPSVRGFGIEYPVASRHLYDPLVETMENSFRARR